MKHIFILLILLLASSTQLLSQKMLRVEDAIAIGLEHNHRIRIARNDAQIAQNNSSRGTANFLPTLDATGSWSFSNSQQETNSPFSFGDSDTRSLGAQLALNWTLFDGFRMFIEDTRYDELSVLGEAQARNVIEQTVVNILGSYFQVVQQSQLLDVLEQTLGLSRTRLEKETVRRELGGFASDFLQASIAYHTDSSAVLEQLLRFAVARKNLNLAMGRDPETTLSVEQEISLPEQRYEMMEMLDMARERNAELNIARQGVRVAEADAALSRSSFYPRISLFANYGYTDRFVEAVQRGEITTLSNDASVGLSFSMNLFNGFRNTVDVQNAVIGERSSTLALEEAEFRLKGLLGEQVQTYQTRRDGTRIEKAKLDAARANLTLQIERYDTGTLSSLEFRDAQLQFVRAETAFITARFQARIALLELQRLIGDIRI